eukprot:TRINITY_DN38040_c0_g2_i2.p1 TRINITY_DN38040_c0_g2~~TRINITY_DN38040_c0_g2_i2.p1  ORF type:complete len:492 (+),score=86.68 TRINITY_DN38040_c0_g2_i2:150-1625(+)
MQKDVDYKITNNERKFILQGLQEGLRIDGRTPNDYRPIKFQMAVDDHSATVLLGNTRVCAVISASIDTPHITRQNEGQLRFTVEFSPMACPSWESGRPGERAIEIARLVERTFRETRSIDLEALCIVVGKHAWNMRVDIHVLDHCGNLVDAACLAALAALMAYRQPEVTVEGDEVIVHSVLEREPQPLTIHHHPLAVTFAFIVPDENENCDCQVLVDPCLEEEAALPGTITIAVNVHGEICQVQKSSGPGISFHSLMQCTHLACHLQEQLMEQVQLALKDHSVARVQARIRRHEGLLIPSEMECTEEWDELQKIEQEEMDVEEQNLQTSVEDLRMCMESSLSQVNGTQDQQYQLNQQKRQRKSRMYDDDLNDAIEEPNTEQKNADRIDNEDDEDDQEEAEDNSTNLQQLINQQRLQKQKRPTKKVKRSKIGKLQKLDDVTEELNNEYMAISKTIADSAGGQEGKPVSLADAFKKSGKSTKQKKLDKKRQNQ